MAVLAETCRQAVIPHQISATAVATPADPARVTRTKTWRIDLSDKIPRTLIDPWSPQTGARRFGTP